MSELDLADAFNRLEIGLWTVLGVVCLAIALRRPASFSSLIAGLTFLAFAGSDWVELETGAWWRPWWLLVWKVGCVSILIGCLLGRRGRRLRRGYRGPESTLPAPQREACAERSSEIESDSK